MKVLFVTYDFPFPITSGGKNRAYHLLKHTAYKAEIYLFSFVREDYNPESNNEILKLGIKDIKVFKRKKLKSIKSIMNMIFNNSSIFRSLYYEDKVLDELTQYIKDKKIDIVHFESSYTGFYIGKKLHDAGVKTILGTENIEYRLYLDYAKTSKKYLTRPLAYYQALKLKKEEVEMIKKADAVTVVTEEEKDFVINSTGIKSNVIANGIEPSSFTYEKNKKINYNILFVGNFDYFPNVEAIRFFVDEVFDHLDQNLTLTIIGKNGSKIINNTNKRIIIKEFVEDIITEYRNSDVLVFPIKVGGGTNFKVLEAMSLGTPIVAEPERMGGLKAIADEHYLRATSPDEYKLQIERIYADVALRNRLTANARLLIDKYFSWKMIGNDLYNLWKNTI